MRLLITLAAAAALAACSHQNENNGVGKAPPETGRVSPSDKAMRKPDTTMTGGYKADTTRRAPPTTTHTSTTLRHDSM